MTKPPYIIDYLGVLVIDVNTSYRKIRYIHTNIKEVKPMDQVLYTFSHYNSKVNKSQLIKLDTNSFSKPHFINKKSQQLPDYKLEFSSYDEKLGYDIYLDDLSLYDIFITYINQIKSSEIPCNYHILIKNLVYPDERYCYKSHANIADSKLLKSFYKIPYKLYCDITLEPEIIENKFTGRISIYFDFSYKLFLLRFGINRENIVIKLNIDQIMDLQTEIYKQCNK